MLKIYIWKYKEIKRYKIILEKKNKVGGRTLTDVKTYYEVQSLVCGYIDGLLEQSRDQK